MRAHPSRRKPMLKVKLSTLITFVVLVAAGTTTLAAAASLSVTSKSLGAGRAAVTVCDSNGFTYTHTLNASHNVLTVTVAGIDPSCAGATLALTLANNLNASIGTATAVLPASGFLGWATLTVTGAPPSATVTGYRVAIS